MRFTSAVVLAATALALGVVRPAFAEDATALLRASIEAPAHISYAGQLENVNFGNTNAEATIFHIEHRAPNLTRRWYVAPQALYGDWSISRGTQTYNVDVKHHRVIVAKNEISDDWLTLESNFSLLAANYRVVSGPSETIAGHDCAAIILMNRYTGQMAMRLWIDKSTHLVLKKEHYAPNGSVLSQTRFDQIQYTNNLPAAIFAAPSLAGYEVSRGLSHGSPSTDLDQVERSAGFKAALPKRLPEGFLLIAGDVSEIKGVRTLQLLYSDGVRTASLFENNRGAAVDLSRFRSHTTHFEDHDAQYVEEGPTTLLAWEESGFHLALVGEIPRTELEHIAASVIP